MVYFNDVNDLRKLQSALADQKRKLNELKSEQNAPIKDNTDLEEEISKKKIKNV